MNNQFIQGVTFDWDRIDNNSYLKRIEAFLGVEKLDFNKPVTFFVGENGSGKSTLLEAIAVAHGFNPEGGTKNYVFSTHDTHSELCDAIRISKGYRKEKWGYFLRAESFYNVATQEEEYADFKHPSAKYHEKSHGESFLALAQNNLRPNGLYLFDEPEAALSPQRQLTLLMQIYRCAKEGAQFFIVTHSPILLGIPDADIYCFDNGSIHLCEYEETESYQVTEMFINNRQMGTNMIKTKNISEMLTSLIEEYRFNKNTLSKYLEITEETIDGVVMGNVECLLDDPALRLKILSKAGFLYFGAIEDKDRQLSGFLEVLVSYYGISKLTIAKMAGVEENDIDRLLVNPPEKIEIEVKYKIAVTVMELRFWLKDCESPI